MNEGYIFFQMWIRMLVIGISLFAFISTILFIWDGIHAKREGTGRKKYITAIFTISMVVTALLAVIGILVFIFALLIVWTK